MRLVDADAIKNKYPDRKSLNQVLDAAPTVRAVEVIEDVKVQMCKNYCKIPYKFSAYEWEEILENGNTYCANCPMMNLYGGVYMNKYAKLLADDFKQTVDEAYIHCEKRANKPAEIMLAGDLLAMMNCINGAIDRIGTVTGNGYEETVSAILGMKKMGYKQVREALSGEPYEQISCENYEEEIRESIEDEVRSVVAKDVERAITELNKAKDTIDGLNSQMRYMKSGYENTIASLQKKIKELNKENKKLEHRLDEVIKENMFPKNEQMF